MRAVEGAFVQSERQRARYAVVHRNVVDDERDRALRDGEHALLADIRHGVVGKPLYFREREGIAARTAALCIAVRDRERVARDDARLCCRFAELQSLGGHGILFICGCGFAVHRSARDGNGKRRLVNRPDEHDGLRLVLVRGALPLVVVCVGDADRHHIAVRSFGVHRAAVDPAFAAARCGGLGFKLRRPVIDGVLRHFAVGGGERRFALFAPGGAGDGRLFDDHGERLGFGAHIYRMVGRGNAVIHGIGARLRHFERACVACFPVRVVCNAEQPGRFLPVYCGRLRFKRLRKAVARIIHEPFRGRDGHARDRRLRHGIEKVARIGLDGIVVLALHVFEGDRIVADARLRADFRLLIGYGGKAEHVRGRVADVQRRFRAHRCRELRLRFAIDARRRIDRNGDRARRNGKRARGNVHGVIFAARILHVDGVRVAPRYHMRAVVGKRRIGGQGKPPVRAFKELIRRVPVAVSRIRPGKRGRFVAVGGALVVRDYPHAALLHRVIFCRIRERVVGVPRVVHGIERRGKVVAAFAPFLERAAARKGHRKTDFSAVHAHIVRGDARDLVRSVIGERGIRPHRRDGALRDVDRKAARRRYVVWLRHPVMHGVAVCVQQFLVVEGCGIPCAVRVIGAAERPHGHALVHRGRRLIGDRPCKERLPVKGIVLIRDAAHRHFGGRDDERVFFAFKGHGIVSVRRFGGNAVRADVFRARAAVDRQRHAEVVLAVYRAIRHGVVRTQHGIDGRMRLPVVRLRRHADGDGDGSLLHGIVFGDVGRERVVAERVVALRKRRGKGILPRVQERAFARRDRYSEGYKAAVRGSVLRRDRLLCAVVGIVIPRPGQRDRHRVDDDRKAARLRFVVGLRHPVMYGVASLVHQLALEGIGIPFAGEAEHPCGRAPVRRVRLLIGDRPCKVRLPVKGIFLVGDIDPRHLGGRDGKERRIRGGRVVLRLVDGNDHGVVARVYRLLRRGELLALAHEVIAVRHLDGVAVDLFLHLGGDAAELQRRLGRRSGIRPAFGSRGEPVLREGDLIPHGERFALFAAHGVAHRFAVARARVEGLFVPGVIIGVPQRYGERVGVVRAAFGELADGVERIVPRDGRLQHARLFVVFDIPAVPLPVGQRGRGNEPFSDRPFEGDGAPCGGIPLARPFIVVVERDDDGIGARIRLRAVLRHRVRRARRGREGDRLLFARVGVRAVDRGFVRFRARDDKRRALFPAELCVGIVVRFGDRSHHIVVARLERFLALRELRIFAFVPAHEPIGVLHLVAVRRLCLRVGRTAVDDAAHRNGKGVGRLPDDPGQRKAVRGIPRTVAPFIIDRVFAQRKRDRISCCICRRERTVFVVRDRLAVCALRRNGHERRVKGVVERAGLFAAVVGIRRRVRPGGFGDLRPRDGECRRIRRAERYFLIVAFGVGGNGGDHIVQPRVDGRIHPLVAAAAPPAVIIGEGGEACPEPRLRRGQRKLLTEGEARNGHVVDLVFGGLDGPFQHDGIGARAVIPVVVVRVLEGHGERVGARVRRGEHVVRKGEPLRSVGVHPRAVEPVHRIGERAARIGASMLRLAERGRGEQHGRDRPGQLLRIRAAARPLVVVGVGKPDRDRIGARIRRIDEVVPDRRGIGRELEPARYVALDLVALLRLGINGAALRKGGRVYLRLDDLPGHRGIAHAVRFVRPLVVVRIGERKGHGIGAYVNAACVCRHRVASVRRLVCRERAARIRLTAQRGRRNGCARNGEGIGGRTAARVVARSVHLDHDGVFARERGRRLPEIGVAAAVVGGAHIFRGICHALVAFQHDPRSVRGFAVRPALDGDGGLRSDLVHRPYKGDRVPVGRGAARTPGIVPVRKRDGDRIDPRHRRREGDGVPRDLPFKPRLFVRFPRLRIRHGITDLHCGSHEARHRRFGILIRIGIVFAARRIESGLIDRARRDRLFADGYKIARERNAVFGIDELYIVHVERDVVDRLPVRIEQPLLRLVIVLDRNMIGVHIGEGNRFIPVRSA